MINRKGPAISSTRDAAAILVVDRDELARTHYRRPAVLVGRPVMKGAGLAVDFIVDLLAAGWTAEQILDNYPHIGPEDIQACLAYAAELLHTEHVVSLQPA